MSDEQSGSGHDGEGDSDSDIGMRTIHIQLGDFDGELAASVMASMQRGQWKERFDEVMAHIARVVPQLADADREATFVAYCAGRMHGCEEAVQLMAVRDDASTQIMSSAISYFGRKHGMTNEQIDAAIHQAQQQQEAERKEQTHAQ